MQSCETDWSYACTNQQIGDAAPGKAFLYEFSQTASNGLCLHGDDVQYVFGSSSFNSEQAGVSAAIMKYWSTFAKTGDPTPADGSLPTWPQWTPEARMQLNITKAPTAVANIDKERCEWFDKHWDYLKVCLPQNPTIPDALPESLLPSKSEL